MNNGARPTQEDKKSQHLSIYCTLTERKIIEDKAKDSNISISQFLRELALKGQGHRKIKVLPKEVLLFTGTLNHLAANMNQVAKKRFQNDELNAIERAGLIVLSTEIKKLAEEIKNFLK